MSIDVDELTFEKKVIKLYKALKLMEKQKHLEPNFSDGIKELAFYIAGVRVSNHC